MTKLPVIACEVSKNLDMLFWYDLIIVFKVAFD